MIGRGKKLNGTLREMWIGIIVWGALCGLITVWFVKDKIGCALGLLLGCLLAMAAAWHMWKMLDQAMNRGGGSPQVHAGQKRDPLWIVGAGVRLHHGDGFRQSADRVSGGDGAEDSGDSGLRGCGQDRHVAGDGSPRRISESGGNRGGEAGWNGAVMGKNAVRFANYIGTVFIFILLCNFSGLFGLRPPTADYGVTLPLGLMTFVLIHFNKLRHKKLKGTLQERITSTRSGSITSVQAVYVPADDLTDPAPATTFAHLDATTVLSRSIVELGIYPAVDPLESTSRILDPGIVGEEHYRVARGV